MTFDPRLSDLLALRATMARGLMADCVVATVMGWRAVSALSLGDRVLTVGAGPMPICGLTPLAPPSWVQHVPAGACGNPFGMDLPPGQGVRVQPGSGAGVLLPAAALEGWRGITCRGNTQAAICIHLTKPALIYTGPGLVVDCGTRAMDLPEARRLVLCWMAEAVGRGLVQPGWGAG